MTVKEIAESMNLEVLHLGNGDAGNQRTLLL